jgi:SSS family solute:Na+ symporter
MIAGFLAAFVSHYLYSKHSLNLGSPIASTWWQAVIAFVADAAVLVGVSLVTKPKPESELRGLVWGLKREEQEEDDSVAGDEAWFRSPKVLGAGAIGLVAILNLLFI